MLIKRRFAARTALGIAIFDGVVAILKGLVVGKLAANALVDTVAAVPAFILSWWWLRRGPPDEPLRYAVGALSRGQRQALFGTGVWGALLWLPMILFGLGPHNDYRVDRDFIRIETISSVLSSLYCVVLVYLVVSTLMEDKRAERVAERKGDSSQAAPPTTHVGP